MSSSSESEADGASLMGSEGETSSTQRNPTISDSESVHQDQATNLIFDKLRPFISNFNKELVEKKLNDLGVETLTDLALLEYKDLEPFMKPIQFRKFASSVKGKRQIFSHV